MSKKAKTIIHSALATEAIKLMQKNQIYSLVVLDQKKQPKGLIRMHDLVEAGLV
jgi:arabinose-5-phosphate isomerase